MTKQNKTLPDRRETGTFHAHGVSDAAAPQGRLMRLTPTSVTGTAAGPQYPKQPEGSPWSGPDPLGPEPPLNEDINAVPDMRTVSGVALESLGDATAASSPSAALVQGGVAATEIKQDLDCSTAQSPIAPPPEPVEQKSED